MGLFDSIKKTAINKIVDNTGKSIGNSIGNSLGKTLGNKIGNTMGGILPKSGSGFGSPAKSGGSQPSAPNVSQNNFINQAASENIDQKFDQILASEFSGLQVVRNAAPGSVGVQAKQPCRPYNYALMRNGKIAVAILLTPHNRDRNSAFLNAKKAALDSKVAFLNFYTHFPNERSYIVSRIKSAL